MHVNSWVFLQPVAVLVKWPASGSLATSLTRCSLFPVQVQLCGKVLLEKGVEGLLLDSERAASVASISLVRYVSHG